MGVAAGRGEPHPVERLFAGLEHTLPAEVEEREVVLGVGEALTGGELDPLDSLGQTLLGGGSLDADPPEARLRPEVALVASARAVFSMGDHITGFDP